MQIEIGSLEVTYIFPFPSLHLNCLQTKRSVILIVEISCPRPVSKKNIIASAYFTYVPI